MDFTPRGAQPSHQGALEHRSGNAGIATNDDKPAVRRQNAAGRPPEGERQIGCELGIRDPADPVGSK